MKTVDPQQLAEVVGGGAERLGRFLNALGNWTRAMYLSEREAPPLPRVKPAAPTRTGPENVWHGFMGRE